jgi:hypothetical protein
MLVARPIRKFSKTPGHGDERAEKVALDADLAQGHGPTGTNNSYFSL